jgi:hypothetical protein
MPIGGRLGPIERIALIVEILTCYRWARQALAAKPIAGAVQVLRAHTPAAAPTASTQQALHEAWRLGRAVQLTLRFAPGDTRCLTRSLVLTQLLARRGIDSKLVIGARAQPSFLAHAWVEHAGHPVLPAGEDSFGRLVEL